MIIYDCEIVKAIAKKDEPRIEGIEYCDGWRDFENMGISVICAYDYAEDRYRVFTGDNMSAFQALVDDTDVVIGFNSLAFDNPLCRANGLNVSDDKSWDLLAEIWAGAGLPKKFESPTHIGFGLDACAAANFGAQKSGNGALAPIAWQRGEVGGVIDYCINDVRLTKMLVDRVIDQGFIRDPRDAERIITVGAPGTPVEGTARKPDFFEQGVLFAAAEIISLHGETTIAADVIHSAGLGNADVSWMDDFDKRSLRKIMDNCGVDLQGL